MSPLLFIKVIEFLANSMYINGRTKMTTNQKILRSNATQHLSMRRIALLMNILNSRALCKVINGTLFLSLAILSKYVILYGLYLSLLQIT